MEAGGKDRSLMLAPVDACPNAMEMWKAIEWLKQENLQTYQHQPQNFIKHQEHESDNTIRTNRGTGYDTQTWQYNNQRTLHVAGARENIARECKKAKRPKDSAYHKEKMLLCKKEEAGIQLSVEQADWRDDSDDEPGDQELETRYVYMEKVFRTWMVFGGNTRDLGSFRKETDKTTTLHKEPCRNIHSEPGDGVATIKRRRHDIHGDGVKDLAMASGRGRLKADLEPST
uniref:Uncharacterized protein n=1 Tax=Tanacetum cinerariifolium TaxID=118510 RepID=A0A6L2MAA0_TANCI|nr:hypothetical protein [Tanacetum cinerariifolium]